MNKTKLPLLDEKALAEIEEINKEREELIQIVNILI